VSAQGVPTGLLRRRHCLMAGAAISAGLTAAGADHASAAVEGTAPAPGDRVRWPDIGLLDGRRLAPPQPGQLASVVVFFTTTCPFCARHNVHVQKLHDAAAALPLRVLGMAHERDPAVVRRYAAARGLQFDMSLDAGPLRAALSPLRGIPLTCVIDRQQRLREVIRGEMFEEDVLGLAKWARS
jgi:peroxiredoxin